jgi:hypothetical protein
MHAADKWEWPRFRAFARLWVSPRFDGESTLPPIAGNAER